MVNKQNLWTNSAPTIDWHIYHASTHPCTFIMVEIMAISVRLNPSRQSTLVGWWNPIFLYLIDETLYELFFWNIHRSAGRIALQFCRAYGHLCATFDKKTRSGQGHVMPRSYDVISGSLRPIFHWIVFSAMQLNVIDWDRDVIRLRYRNNSRCSELKWEHAGKYFISPGK